MALVNSPVLAAQKVAADSDDGGSERNSQFPASSHLGYNPGMSNLMLAAFGLGCAVFGARLVVRSFDGWKSLVIVLAVFASIFAIALGLLYTLVKSFVEC